MGIFAKKDKYESVKEWRTIFDSIADLVSIVDRDFRLKTVNKAFTDVFGKQPEELIGTRCCKLVHNTKEPPENCPLRKTLSTGKAATTEIYYDSLRKHLEVSTFPIFDDKGEVIEAAHFIRDITERKLMEEARKKADAELRNASRFNEEIISNAGVGVIVYDPQLRYLEWNTFMENLTGMEKKAIIGKSAIEIFPHLREQGIDKLLLRALAGETVSSPDTIYRCAQTGKSGWVVGTYTPHRNSVGQIIGVIGMVRDITEHKQAEQELKDSEIRLKTIFDNVRDGILVADIETRKFQMYNNAICQMLGYSEEEIMRLSVNDIHPAEDLPRVIEGFERQARGEFKLAESLPVKRKDGSVFYADVNTSIITLGGKKYIMGSFRDITERKRLEETLEKERQELKLIIDSSPVIVFYKDKDGRFVRVNKAFAESLNIPEEKFLGKTVFDFYSAKIAQGMTSDDQEVFRSARPKLNIVEQYESAKGLRWVQTDKVPIFDEDGILVGLVGFAQDITERKRAEEELKKARLELEQRVVQRTAQLQKTIEEKNRIQKTLQETEKLATAGKLAAQIAHEINNPMAGIKNSFLLIKDAIPQNHRYFEYVGRIEKEIDRVSQIVSRMFDLYRPDTAPVHRFRLYDTIRDIVELLKVARQEKHINIEIDCSEKTTVTLSEALLRQIIYNIVQNAIQASGPDTTVKICARTDNKRLNLSVSDQGPGIDDKIKDRIFEPFFTTGLGGPKSGLGLGLAITKDIISAMDGTINFTSEKNKGTVFNISIPIANESAE